MPKQVQYTKDCIINASIEILRSQGSGALSSRTICKRLGCSVAPLFREFSNMDELLDCVWLKAEDIFRRYTEDSVYYNPAFKEFGTRLICFSKEDPNLFHFLFLEKGRHSDAAEIIAMECLKQTSAEFGLTEEQTVFVYGQSWPFACGLAQLSCNNTGQYTEEYVSQLLSTQFKSIISLIRSGRNVVTAEPHLIPDGKNVFLRRWKESDAPALYRLASDPDVGPRAGWPVHGSQEESLGIIRTVFNNPTTWAVVLKETGEVIGAMGYGPSCDCGFDSLPGEPTVGYWIGKRYWNNGFCTEALQIMLRHILDNTDICSLISGHFVDNPASGRVMEKCGFIETGEITTSPGLMVGKDKKIRVLRLKLR